MSGQSVSDCKVLQLLAAQVLRLLVMLRLPQTDFTLLTAHYTDNIQSKLKVSLSQYFVIEAYLVSSFHVASHC